MDLLVDRTMALLELFEPPFIIGSELGNQLGFVIGLFDPLCEFFPERALLADDLVTTGFPFLAAERVRRTAAMQGAFPGDAAIVAVDALDRIDDRLANLVPLAAIAAAGILQVDRTNRLLGIMRAEPPAMLGIV